MNSFDVHMLAPNHDHTSCSDENWGPNAYFNEMGYPRCTRCVLLHYLKHGEFPYNAEVEHTTIQFRVKNKSE
jgi:hypothetical protein